LRGFPRRADAHPKAQTTQERRVRFPKNASQSVLQL
jgi:hypothetical protein